jgi:hypothetical protein
MSEFIRPSGTTGFVFSEPISPAVNYWANFNSPSGTFH